MRHAQKELGLLKAVSRSFYLTLRVLPGKIRPQISLDGEWQFRRDKENRGSDLGYQQGRGDFTEKIKIPGAPQAQGLGAPNHSQKWFLNEPFWVRRCRFVPSALIR